jgi:hypothetical protein
MKQFAPHTLQQWIDQKPSPPDKLLQDAIAIINVQQVETPTEYVMNIFVKDPIDNNITGVKNRLITF